MTQAWGTLKNPTWYAATPLRDFCHVAENQQAARYSALTPAESSGIKRILLEAAPSSALAMHEKRKRGEVKASEEKAVNPFVQQVIGRTTGPVMDSIPPGALTDPFYLDRVAVSVEEAERLCSATTEQSGSQLWK